MSTSIAPVVTDGEKLKCAERAHELFTRFKKNVYTKPQQVLDGLQQLIEGRTLEIIPAVVKNIGKVATLAVWKTIKIGGVKTTNLITQVADAVTLGDWARDIMGQKAFTVSETEESVDLVALTPADLGFTENPTTKVLFDPERLLKWSKENLEGYVLELCPAEVGPHLRLQYMDQPKGDVLWIAMERITGSDGRPHVFHVERLGDGEFWLDALWAPPDGGWPLGFRLVFRLRKIQN